MSWDRYANIGIRYANALALSLKNFSLNRRFINLNIFVGFLIIVILLQSFLLNRATGNSSNNPLVLMKGDVYASNYDNILKKYDVQKFQKMSLNKKCNIFFDTLNIKNNDWKLDDFNTDGYDENLYSFDAFINQKKAEDKNLVLSEKKIYELEDEYIKKSSASNRVDTKIIDAISTLRVFDRCFIEADQTTGFKVSNFIGGSEDEDDDSAEETRSKGNQDLCLDTESRIFPWLSNFLPTYTRWDGTVGVGLPDLSDLGKYGKDEYDDITQKEKRSTRTNCFLTKFKKDINGKGYVISASDAQVDELKRLALVLRAIGNKLPIQIVHKGDLSNDAQKELVKHFRREISFDDLPISFQNVRDEKSLSFPPQELWFVNVRRAVNPNFNKHFQRYANKLLAYLFNSFEEMILIDTDTVPFVNLEEILSYPEYQTNGAYFFQDRNLRGQNTEIQVNYFRRLFPSKLDSHFFGIKEVGSHTLDNRFFGGRRNHYMESGVVAINRKKHFSGMLMAVQLNFWGPTATKVHGDKELFWLGMSLSGDENYVFNKFGAASIGEITKKDNKRLPGSAAAELCSNHPGHVDAHGDKERLIWMNSGFTYCKNTDSAGQDKDRPLYKGMSEDEVRKLYKGATKIRAAIIPPPQEVESPNDFGNPTNGWTDEHKYCWGYTWCAYDFIGTGSSESERGTMILFEDNETQWFDFIGDLWMDGIPESKKN